MAYYSGKEGTIKCSGNVISPVSNWRLSKSSNNPAFNTNVEGGVKTRIAGVKDSNGSFDFVLDDGENVPFDEGDTATLELRVDGASGDDYYEVPVIIDEVSVDVDINDGGQVVVPITFSGVGAITAHGTLAKATGGSGS
jgi:hypothetical protein